LAALNERFTLGEPGDRAMKSLIVIIIGFLGGVAFSVAYPDLALKLNGQRERLMAEGAEKALSELKTQLDQKAAVAKPATATPPGGLGFAGPMGVTAGKNKSEVETLKEITSVVDQKLAEVQAKK
jgi:hypothetical protein